MHDTTDTMEMLKAGDIVRLLVPTITGWMGRGVVFEDQRPDDDGVIFAKATPPTERCQLVAACRHEVERLSGGIDCQEMPSE